MASGKDEFAKLRAKQKRLGTQLAAAPVVQVLGVVSASGCGGGMSQGETLWTMQFTVDAWRIKGAGIQNTPLEVQRQVGERALEQYMKAVEPYSVVRFSGRVVEKSVFGRPEARLERLFGVDTSDAELNAAAAALQKPVTFKDATLGKFTLERRYDWFAAKPKWLGKRIILQLSATEPDDLKNALKTAHSLFKAQKAWSKRIGDFAVKELLPLKNDTWLEDDETRLTPKDFKARMKLESITVNPDGSFEFWHDDGDLFWGHSIQISGCLAKGPTDADIPG